MKHAALLASMCLFTAACSSPEAMERHRTTCASYGHVDGSPEMSSCVERKSQQTEETASRIGTSVLTKVLIGTL